MNKVPEVFAAALYRRPFVTLLNSMTDPSLPMTAHEYDEWGDPADADVVHLWAHLSPHKQIKPGACGTANRCVTNAHDESSGSTATPFSRVCLLL